MPAIYKQKALAWGINRLLKKKKGQNIFILMLPHAQISDLPDTSRLPYLFSWLGSLQGLENCPILALFPYKVTPRCDTATHST